jgi:hypothetical protein
MNRDGLMDEESMDEDIVVSKTKRGDGYTTRKRPCEL